MEGTITSAKLTGSPSGEGWAQIHDFTPEDVEKFKKRGRLFAVLATSRASVEEDHVNLGREMLTRLHEEYFGKLEKSAFEALKDAVEKVIAEFKENGESVEIAAGACLNGVFYSAVGGGAQAVLYRNTLLAKILVSDKAQTVSASGYPEKGDKFLLATSCFFQVFTEGVIKAALENRDLKKTIESLAPTVHSRNDVGCLGAVVIEFGTEDEQDLTEEGPEEQSLQGHGARLRIANFLEAIINRIPTKKIYVGGGKTLEKERKRKTALTAGAILFLLLVVSIAFGVKQRNERQLKSRYESRLTQAEHDFEEADKLSSLNPDRARELFIESNSLVDEIVNEGFSDERLTNLQEKLKSSRGKILGEYEATPEIFVDLSLFRDGFVGNDMASSGEIIYVLDKKGKRVVSVDVDTKRTQVVAGNVENAQRIVSYSDRSFVLNNDGLIEVTGELKRVIDKDWGGDVLAYAYAGNIYLLDKNTSEIYRYPGTGSSFGTKQSWLAPGIEPSLSNIQDWTVNGSIWMISQDARILKYTRGVPEEITTSSYADEIKEAQAIYSNENLEFVYILDKGNSKIVVIDKDGKFIAQYVSEKISSAIDLVVSEKEGKIIFLAEGGKLYSIKIEHI
jgi:hypothetical protein